MSSVSPTWSPCPCVSTICETPLLAAALSETKAGLPVKNGSISTALPAKSRRKAEVPNQVIFITRVPLLVRPHNRRRIAEFNHALCIVARALLGQTHARPNPAARRDCAAARSARRADRARPRRQDDRGCGEAARPAPPGRGRGQ